MCGDKSPPLQAKINQCAGIRLFRQLSANSVAKVDNGFLGRKVRAEIEIFTVTEDSVLRFRVAVREKIVSAANMRAVWKDRLFQHHRPKAVIQTCLLNWGRFNQADSSC